MKSGNHATRRVALGILIVAMLSATATAGEAPRIDASTSMQQLRTLAAQGNGDAMLALGERLAEGQGTEANPTEALKWLQQAAETGETQAWYDLGFVYANGLLGEPDMPKAIGYFSQGAEAGNADCQTSMGMFYQAGEKIPNGLKADPAEAMKWYRLAAEQDHTEAIQHLAMMCAMGQGVNQDYAEAAQWFRKGAELGNADCQWGLGQCYLDGKGLSQDTVQAYALFTAAIEGVENPEQKQAMAARCDALGKALTPDQIKKAEPLLQEWKAKSSR